GKSRKWWGRYRDENGCEKRVPLAADKTAAQTMLNERLRKVERRAAGLDDPLENHHKRPLADHIADFAAYLKNKGSTDTHVNKTRQRIDAIVNHCRFERITELSASRVQEFLAQLRSRGRSIASSNHYLRAIKMFTRWLVRDRRATEDRLAHLSRMNAETDRRRVRRPFSLDSFVKLLEAAESGPRILDLAGPDRAVLYLLGAYTGFRRKEIASIRP